MPDAPYLTWYAVTEYRRTFTICCNQKPKVQERIHLPQLFILNEYAAHYAVARHYLGFVAVDE